MWYEITVTPPSRRGSGPGEWANPHTFESVGIRAIACRTRAQSAHPYQRIHLVDCARPET
jgi:hypothetical protein